MWRYGLIGLAVFSFSTARAQAPWTIFSGNPFGSDYHETATAESDRIDASEAAPMASAEEKPASGAVAPTLPSVTATAPAARFVSFSTVTALETSRASTTIGFAVGGAGTAGTKPILVRAVGPSLARFGTPDLNRDPKIELFSGPTKIAENDNWNGQPFVIEAAARVGAFPLSSNRSADAALVLDAGHSDLTIKVSGQRGATGEVLTEIYDATPSSTVTAKTPRLINFFVLKSVPADSNVSAGFVIAGKAPKAVLIRVLGPALADFGLSEAMVDPVLTLFQDVSPIATNNGWGGTAGLKTAFASAGATALDPDSKDAALLITLAPGSYAVQASAASNAAGAVLMEIYEMP
jgi:hypothetical protein